MPASAVESIEESRSRIATRQASRQVYGLYHATEDWADTLGLESCLGTLR